MMFMVKNLKLVFWTKIFKIFWSENSLNVLCFLARHKIVSKTTKTCLMFFVFFFFKNIFPKYPKRSRRVHETLNLNYVCTNVLTTIKEYFLGSIKRYKRGEIRKSYFFSRVKCKGYNAYNMTVTII